MRKKPYQGKYESAKPVRKLPWLLVVPTVMLVVALCAIGRILVQRQQERMVFQQLSAAVHETTRPAETVAPTEASGLPAEETRPAEAVTEPAETEPPETEPEYLVRCRTLQEVNPEFFGWLQIEGMVVDYPVMHTPNDPEKYLHRDFYGEESYAGVPFIDYRCTEDSDNLLIYGHNMADGTMFHTLVDYQKKDHWEEHPVIRFDTVEGAREFEVVAAFYDRIYYTHETNFKFYNFIDAANETEYNSAVKQFKKKALYDTGVTPEYGQQLITLVTCTYQVENGRFVVVACEKDQHQ